MHLERRLSETFALHVQDLIPNKFTFLINLKFLCFTYSQCIVTEHSLMEPKTNLPRIIQVLDGYWWTAGYCGWYRSKEVRGTFSERSGSVLGMLTTFSKCSIYVNKNFLDNQQRMLGCLFWEPEAIRDKQDKRVFGS